MNNKHILPTNLYSWLISNRSYILAVFIPLFHIIYKDLGISTPLHSVWYIPTQICILLVFHIMSGFSRGISFFKIFIICPEHFWSSSLYFNSYSWTLSWTLFGRVSMDGQPCIAYYVHWYISCPLVYIMSTDTYHESKMLGSQFDHTITLLLKLRGLCMAPICSCCMKKIYLVTECNPVWHPVVFEYA